MLAIFEVFFNILHNERWLSVLKEVLRIRKGHDCAHGVYNRRNLYVFVVVREHIINDFSTNIKRYLFQIGEVFHILMVVFV